ncbi:WXG100 family type VII secretion target [Kitasatospora sp. NPDC052868]|uniref:WXG100 family type VII secretion target n=1 Tax=Kitasatospora sp. NPDC052868 TaxID=3364060 RepID=UPI0037C90FA1
MTSPYSNPAFAVNPSALEGCGQTAQHLGSQIPPETAKITEPNDQAASTLQGWLTGPAIHNCAANWKTLLDKIAGDIGSAGTKLTTAATAYRQNEQNVSMSMNGVTATGTYRPPVNDPFNTVLTSDLSPAAEARRAAGAGKAQ